MKLYELSTGMWFHLGDLHLELGHIDGMYGVCYDQLGTEHLVRLSTEVEVEHDQPD